MRSFFLRIFLILFPILNIQGQPLEVQDVRGVMQEIFKQHLDQREMNEAIIRSSFKLYIDQFDPDRVYLLESEAAPYINLSDAQVQTALNGYKNGDFSAWQALNDVVQNAILRARAARLSALETDHPVRQAFKTSFAKSKRDLEQKIRSHIASYALAAKGEDSSRSYRDIRAQYEEEKRDVEDTYLYKTANGGALSQSEQDNFFALHLLKAMASGLDSHTKVLDPEEAFRMRSRLLTGFWGVGIEVKGEGGDVLVSRLLEGGPAERSGLVHVNDKLLEVNDISVKSASIESLKERLRGGEEEEVTLLLERGGDKVKVKLKMAQLNFEDERAKVTWQPYSKGIIGIITLDSFYQGDNGITAVNDVKQGIKELKEKGNLRGLVLDLRENSGGFLIQAVKVAGLFITNGVVVVSKYSNGEQKVYRDMDGKIYYSGPMIVLTSRATASAAEIVAQALQDWGVAVVVGDGRTYGKGTIQSQTVTDDWSRSFFKVTVGKYYTVSGKTPQQMGVKSDVVVPGKYEFEQIGEEYLEHPVGGDTIGDVYADPLHDVDPSLKEWYMRYYLPTLQRKKDQWRPYFEPLRQASKERMIRNGEYQAYLKTEVGDGDSLQLAETMNVMKDMIDIRSQRYTPPVVERSR